MARGERWVPATAIHRPGSTRPSTATRCASWRATDQAPRVRHPPERARVKAAAYSTEDLDVARSRRLDVRAGESFANILVESTVPLGPVPGFEHGSPSTSYKVRAGSFRVDLLMPTSGSDVRTMPVPELAAHATGLPFLAYLLEDPIEAIALAREVVVPIVVPRPEAFAWHKVLVSRLRGATREKQYKDLHQAAVLFAVLAVDAPDAIESAFRAMPRGTRTRTREGIAALRPLLEDAGHERAIEVLETAVLSKNPLRRASS